MTRRSIALLLVSACGGPHLDSKPLTTRTYVATSPCGQNLVDTSFVAKGARWGESISIVACGARDIAGSMMVETVTRDAGRFAWNGSFGRGRDNRRCVTRDAEVAATASSATSPTTSRAGAGTSGSLATSPASKPITAFRQSDFPGTVCKYAGETVMMLGRLEAGTRINVRVWSREPNDLEGAVIRIRHNIEKPNVSDAKWKQHLARESAKYEAAIARGEEIGEPLFKPGQPQAPPPAATAESPPPRPSTHAEWVAGYWHWADPDWLWIAGSWRVPAGDISSGLTVRAPHQPPALADEARPQPRAGLLWSAGYWQWNDTSFIWVPGCWRIAPSATSRWRPPRWQAAAKGVIFLPGGWF